jgi:hypothetical protein
MIIKIFKISTKEMYTFRNKSEFNKFVRIVTNKHPSFRLTIDQLIKYLPVEDYCRAR